MFHSRRFLFLLATSTLGFAAPALRAAPTAPVLQDECADGFTAGFWKLPATSAGHGDVLGALVDPSNRRDKLRLRADLTDEASRCATCIQGSVHGYLDDGHGGPPRYEVEGSYEGSMNGDGRFDLRIHELNGGSTLGEIHGEFASPRSVGFHGRFRGEWRIC